MSAQSTSRLNQRAAVAAGRPWVRLSRWRINVLLFLCLLLIARIVLRLGELQVLRHAELRDLANREIARQITLMPTRGMITDRLGNVLAIDVDRESLWVVPSQVNQERAPRLALTLSTLVGKPAE
ncbi:MAG: penicillin-binding protein 2, partial [Chloroflexaceae bacterium]